MITDITQLVLNFNEIIIHNHSIVKIALDAIIKYCKQLKLLRKTAVMLESEKHCGGQL